MKKFSRNKIIVSSAWFGLWILISLTQVISGTESDRFSLIVGANLGLALAELITDIVEVKNNK